MDECPLSPDEEQSKPPAKDERDKSAPKKKIIDVFWMDDEEGREQFQQKEQAERRKANWQDVKDEDVISQLMPDGGYFGEPPSSEEDWEREMQQFEREMRYRTRSGSLAERVSNKALHKFMEAQQRGGTQGRISRILGNLFAKIFGVIGRSGMPSPHKTTKKKQRPKAPNS